MKDANTSAVPSMFLLLLLCSLLSGCTENVYCVSLLVRSHFFSALALVYKKGLTKGLTRKIGQNYEINFRIRFEFEVSCYFEAVGRLFSMCAEIRTAVFLFHRRIPQTEY